MPRGVYPRPSLEERLWRNTAMAANGCTEWQGPFSPTGYGHIGGRIGDRKVTFRTHRLAYELSMGPIPVGMIVRHRCDNPPCINPDHLEIGTHRDNANDRGQRQRTACRERNGTAVLTPEQVEEIRYLYGSRSATQKSLGERFGVSQAQISKILRRAQWK